MAATHSYKGYEIPVELMLLTGGGPKDFDAVSQWHFSNICKWIGIRPDHTVLEIGCGIGRDAIPLSEYLADGRYIGVDIIQRSIEWCSANISSRHPNFSFLHFDVKDQLHNPSGIINTTDIQIPLEDQSIDRIFLFSVFTHMMQLGIEHYLRQFRRLLKPDGLVYATTFIYNEEILKAARKTNLTPWNLRFEYEINANCRINDVNFPLGAVAYTRDIWNTMVSKCGFRLKREPLTGAWSGFYPHPEEGQDVMLLEI